MVKVSKMSVKITKFKGNVVKGRKIKRRVWVKVFWS